MYNCINEKMISDHTVLKMAPRQQLVNILSKISAKNGREKRNNKKEHGGRRKKINNLK